jgi:hypothetical protein
MLPKLFESIYRSGYVVALRFYFCGPLGWSHEVVRIDVGVTGRYEKLTLP